MKTAIQARQEIHNESENLKYFERLVENAISDKTNSFRTSIEFTDSEVELIGELGYSIWWNRTLLEYEIEF